VEYSLTTEAVAELMATARRILTHLAAGQEERLAEPRVKRRLFAPHKTLIGDPWGKNPSAFFHFGPARAEPSVSTSPPFAATPRTTDGMIGGMRTR
jgi:hypothetical protein